MRLTYYPETGSLYIDLKSGVAADSHEVADGVSTTRAGLWELISMPLPLNSTC